MEGLPQPRGSLQIKHLNFLIAFEILSAIAHKTEWSIIYFLYRFCLNVVSTVMIYEELLNNSFFIFVSGGKYSESITENWCQRKFFKIKKLSEIYSILQFSVQLILPIINDG